MVMNMSEAMADALWCMLTGMVGIFSVTLIIIICIKILNAFSKNKSDDDTQQPK